MSSDSRLFNKRSLSIVRSWYLRGTAILISMTVPLCAAY